LEVALPAGLTDKVNDVLMDLGASHLVSASARWDTSKFLEDEKSVSHTMVLNRENIKPALFDYQEDLVSKVTAIHGTGGKYLLSLPTGAGKTRTAMAAVLDVLNQRPTSRCLWLAPSRELIDQAASTFAQMWRSSADAPDCSVGVRGENQSSDFLWLQTPQHLHARQNSLDDFELVIFDEAHQLGAPTFRSAVELVCGSPESTLLGLSATPGRADDVETVELVKYFSGRLLTSDVLGSNPVRELQDRGVLSRLDFKRISPKQESWDKHNRRRAVIQLVKKLAERGRQTLVFTETVAESVAFSEILKHQSYPVDFVDGTISNNERSDRLAGFASGRIKVIFNQRLLATGYDCPAVSDVVLGSRIGSPVLFEQIVGRAARGPLTGGSTYARVWEFENHREIHGLPQSYYRYRQFSWN